MKTYNANRNIVRTSAFFSCQLESSDWSSYCFMRRSSEPFAIDTHFFSWSFSLSGFVINPQTQHYQHAILPFHDLLFLFSSTATQSHLLSRNAEGTSGFPGRTLALCSDLLSFERGDRESVSAKYLRGLACCYLYHSP